MSETGTHAGPTPAGMVLGSYRILHELTSGGMGTVFRAEHVLLSRPAEQHVLRAKHRAHAAARQLVQDPVTPQDHSRGRGAGVCAGLTHLRSSGLIWTHSAKTPRMRQRNDCFKLRLVLTSNGR